MVLIITGFLSLCVLISLILAILKWTGVITLSWWIITAPMLGGYSIVCLVLCAMLLAAALSEKVSRKKQ